VNTSNLLWLAHRVPNAAVTRPSHSARVSHARLLTLMDSPAMFYCKLEIVIVIRVGVLILIAFRLHKWLMRLSPDLHAPHAGQLRQTKTTAEQLKLLYQNNPYCMCLWFCCDLVLCNTPACFSTFIDLLLSLV